MVSRGHGDLAAEHHVERFSRDTAVARLAPMMGPAYAWISRS